jgi:hypothetical protein
MSQINRLEEDEVLTVRVYKTAPGSQIAWANTYEVIVDNPSQDVNEVATRLNNLKNVFVNLERGLLCAAYLLDRVIISTYVPDSLPYNPFTFASYTVTAFGQYGTGSTALIPLELCTLVKRLVNFGRQGSLLYRGIVARPDVNIGATGTIIDNARVNQISSLLNTFINNVRQLGFDLVMASGQGQGNPIRVRRISGFEVKRDMRFKKLNNRYFDRLRN